MLTDARLPDASALNLNPGGLLVIGFYSIGTPYEQEAKTLVASLDRVGMAHKVTGFADRGGWYQNTAAKADLILDARTNIRGPLLYIDVDAFVHVNCTDDLLERTRGADFGVHMFAGPAKGKKKRTVCRCVALGSRPYNPDACDRPHRLLSGTLFLGDTPGALALCENWVALNQTMRERGLVHGGGQKNLWFLTTCMKDLNIARLPGRYTYVYDKSWGYPPNEPVWIEHLIASRENRDTIRLNRPRQNRIAELKRVVR